MGSKPFADDTAKMIVVRGALASRTIQRHRFRSDGSTPSFAHSLGVLAGLRALLRSRDGQSSTRLRRRGPSPSARAAPPTGQQSCVSKRSATTKCSRCRSTHAAHHHHTNKEPARTRAQPSATAGCGAVCPTLALEKPPATAHALSTDTGTTSTTSLPG